ncbi:transposase [Wenyingzhuangia sp. IMCC45574]
MSRKVKYTFEFKRKCVLLFFKEHQSVISICKELKLHHSIVYRWCQQYEKDGLQGLLPKQTKHYSPSFKLNVLQAIDRENLSMAEASLIFNIGGDSVIHNWRVRYNSLGLEGLQDKPKGRPIGMKTKHTRSKSKPLTKEEELLKENQSLKAELDLLKKLHALAQTREKKQ